MKVLNFVKYFFLLSGLGMMVGAFFLYQSTQQFIKESVSAPGIVTELIRQRSTDSDGNTSYTYYPLVEFQSPKGETIEFQSNSGSYPASYRVGEAVEVLYLPDTPEQAKIKAFSSLWLGALILAIIGLVDTAVGVGMIWYGRMKKKKMEWLKQFGRRISTKFKSVEYNTSYKVNGRSPYRIFSQTDENGQVYIFTSENLWFDPTGYLQKDQEINVVVDPQNMKKYYMDISFLPELKN